MSTVLLDVSVCEYPLFSFLLIETTLLNGDNVVAAPPTLNNLYAYCTFAGFNIPPIDVPTSIIGALSGVF